MATTGGGTSASTAIIKVTPISGSRQECAPACYLLEIDQAKILLDAGTTSCFNCDHLNTLRRITKSIDLVLLSHGDLRHCGALPRLLATFQINGPVLATVPVHHMGLVTLYDAYEAHYQVDGQAPPGDMTLDHVDAAFERITMLRYSQSYTCTAGPAMGIQLTPLAAGHTLGGAIWRIRKHSEEIFYMMDFNHKREAHLDGASLEVIQRPTLLIADSKGALEVHATRKQRDSELLDSLLGPLRAGGSVLVPVETAGRVLELLQVIDAHWVSHRLPFPVIFLSHQSRRVLDLSKGMLEWMSQGLTRVFEQDRTNPFDLRSVRACHSMSELEAISGPKVILATFSSLDTGFGRSCLADVLASPTSAIILATKTESDAMAAKILSLAKGSRATISFAKKVPLEGDELERYLQEERDSSERRAAELAFAKLQREREEEEDAEEDEDEEEEEEREEGEARERKGGSRVRMAEGGAEMGTEAAESKRLEQEQINSAAALRNFYWTDYRKDWFIESDSIISKLAQGPANSPYYPIIPPEEQASAGGGGMPIRHQVFPFRERRKLADAYGEMVDPLEFKPKGTPSGPAAEATTGIARIIQTLAPLPTDSGSSSGAALPPSKWATINQEVTSKAAKKFIDVSGLSDGRSLKTIYSRIQPRRIVFVGGSGEATDFLVNHFLQSAAQAGRTSMEVFSPHLGETVTVCSAVNVMQVTLAESLISKLQLQLLGDYELTWVRGAVKLEAGPPTQIDDTTETFQEMMAIDSSMETDGDARDGVRSPLEEGEVIIRTDSKPRIFLTEPSEAETVAEAGTVAGSGALMLGDPKLSEIRRILQSQLNIPATFISGELVCGAGERRVMIRREADEARFSIEGPLCEEYYAVREALYALTTLVQ